MKVVRFTVIEAPDGGFSVLRLCPQWYAHGACRHELVCTCVHTAGGPFRDHSAHFDALPDALRFCEASEAGRGGVRSVPSGVPCDAQARAAFVGLDPADVPY